MPEVSFGPLFTAWRSQGREERRASWRESSKFWREKNPRYLSVWKKAHPNYERDRRRRNPDASRNAAQVWRMKNSPDIVRALVARQVFRRERRSTFYQPICCIRCRGRRFYFMGDVPVCRRCCPACSPFPILAGF